MRWSILSAVLLAACLGTAPPLALAATAPAATSTANQITPQPWPRTYTVDGLPITLHLPQLDSWEGNVLSGRIAVEIKTGTARDKQGKARDTLVYGVMWFTARAETDKAARTATLRDAQIARVSFPTAPEKQDEYLALLRKLIPAHELVADLDHLESALAIQNAQDAQAGVPVRNDPPQILFSFGPAVLVSIDGTPVEKATGEPGVTRVINTRSLLLKEAGRYYLGFGGHWEEAGALTGPWQPVKSVSAGVSAAARALIKDKQVDPLDPPPDALKQALADGRYPSIHVASTPTELLVVDGEPQFAPIPGTRLSYITNSPADVFIDAAHDGEWYVLVSGRWFQATGSKGPWHYVPGDKLPLDFKRIPSDSPKSAVLASIPGTPEARESLIANSVPQTATIKRSDARLEVIYDGGAPQFQSIPGTRLRYARNTATAVIEIDASHYYALQNAVWFTAASPTGPWQVATSVPAAIYAIPASSPVHYVTYVYVYGSTPDLVYVGYTPGYYGTVVSNGVVVYGTGYVCDAWIGDVWYGCPATYGYGVNFGWDPWVGWSFAFAWGMAWGAAWYGPYWGPWWGWYGPWYGPWYGGGFAVTNVYGRWGPVAASGVRAGWSDPWTGNVGTGVRGTWYNNATGGHGAGQAWRNTNVYTGTQSAGAAGIRYNPETGRVVAGQGRAAYNPYTGNAAAGGSRTVVNTQTGRVTTQAGVAGRTDQGAGAAGAFTTAGKGGDAAGAGYVHYDAATGQVNHGGVVHTDDHLYAGKDGNVYRYDKGQGWQQVTRPGQGNQSASRGINPDQARSLGLPNDQLARERGQQRTFSRSLPSSTPNWRTSGGLDRGHFSPSFRGNMGGFRGGGGFHGFRR
ncbi:hypothetical protein [Chitiniphilus eburneus]|uniref:Carbohydrate-binding family V/XII n=1 Tax=Chitiniphilus eburneus TaxID=2571148 RepID=A0A4U0Q1A9_9NEIS|nr:hypothetical protein [Chitiniphilus eburneus]TJZ74793.1 hypothetical protein FAZ21_07415 [Chitiniphilus eburneus]